MCRRVCVSMIMNCSSKTIWRLLSAHRMLNDIQDWIEIVVKWFVIWQKCEINFKILIYDIYAINSMKIEKNVSKLECWDLNL